MAKEAHHSGQAAPSSSRSFPQALRLDDLPFAAYDAVQAAQDGQRIRITQDGLPVAALVSFEDVLFLDEIDTELDKRDAADLPALRQEWEAAGCPVTSLSDRKTGGVPVSTVVFTNRARRDLTALPPTVQRRMLQACDGLAKDPRHAGVVELVNTRLPGSRVRLGSYRLMFQIEQATRTVLVLKVGHRRDLYR